MYSNFLYCSRSWVFLGKHMSFYQWGQYLNWGWTFSFIAPSLSWLSWFGYHVNILCSLTEMIYKSVFFLNHLIQIIAQQKFEMKFVSLGYYPYWVMVSNVLKTLRYWWFHREQNYLINLTILNFSVRIVFPEAFLKVKPACILIIL